jgi:hypothetical protein
MPQYPMMGISYMVESNLVAYNTLTMQRDISECI